ncbi:MAG: hypothetical protein HY717_10125 [Planctomycetes bacterium]|nr:hypothetical protein [Planctomycetota bacterium]
MARLLATDFSLPPRAKKVTFRALYRELDLERAVLRTYTKSLFFPRKSLSASLDRRTLYDFARRTPQNVERIHQALVKRAFHFREGLELHYNFNGKQRKVYLFPWEERIVDLLLYRLLNAHFHGAFSSSSYAYRHRGRGVDLCQRRIARKLQELPRPLYFLKRDIADCFLSIDHAILLELLAEWVEPEDYLFDLLRERVEFRFKSEGEEAIKTASRGVPFGAAIACFFANLYLTPLDRELASIPGFHFFRYADDMLGFSTSRESALEGSRRLEEAMKALKLLSKPSHHRDFAFSGGDEADEVFQKIARFRHLGLEFRAAGGIGLSRDKVRKVCNQFRYAFRRGRRKLEALADPEDRARLAVDLARGVLEKRFRPVAIIDYYLKHVDDEEQLRWIDRWLAEEVLAVAFRNGHKKGNFRRMSFEKLRAMGLPSLRHRRRLLHHGHLESSFFVFRTRWLVEKKRRRLPGRRGGENPSSQAFSPGLEAAAE